MKKVHFESIADYYHTLGKPMPEHPLIDVFSFSAEEQKHTARCMQDNQVISANFYCIALKTVLTGEILYGKTKYDCQNGTMLFFAPNQTFYTTGVQVESVGKMILFHEDYLRGHELQSQLKKCRFFDYAVNEALHLSPKEQQLICRIFDSIEAEYHSSYDALSREIMLSQMSTLLRYAERFYRRQFLVRKEFHSSIYESFNNLLYQYMYVSDVYRTPSISDIAQQLNMTPRYLTDALKVETGKSAKEWIQLALVDKAKNLLLSSNDSVATVAYSLGFEYPQYFSRLFKNKVGITPTEYRKQTARH